MFETIMIADGNVENRDFLYETFSAKGHKVICVPNANEALLDLQKERPDCIVIDEHIKPLGGIETIKRIRQFDANIRIVLLASDTPDDTLEAQKYLYTISEIVKKDEGFLSLTTNRVLRLLETPRSQKSGERFEGSILIVDDEQEIRDFLSRFLKERGFSVSTAKSGDEALLQLKTSTPFIVLLDIRMPGMDGLVVLRNIRKISQSVKIVMLTAIQDKDIVDDAFREGACDYLVKPIDLAHLTGLLSSLTKPLADFKRLQQKDRSSREQ